MSGLVLYADIGGTFARFAFARAGERPHVASVLATQMMPDLSAAIGEAMRANGVEAPLAGAAIAGAGPVVDGAINLTNAGWRIDAETIARATGVVRPLIVNDFTAQAAALAALTQGDVDAFGGGAGDPHAPRAIVGPGTGFGVSALVPCGRGRFVPLAAEGGHVDLAPGNARELAIFWQLQQQFGHVSCERVLSGSGMEVLYGAIAALDGVAIAAKPTPAEIAQRARAKSDAVAVETIAVFTGLLGAAAGNVVLTTGATGGIYLAGGILPRWGDLFDRALFRHRMEAKGRMRDYLARVPSFLVTAPDAAMIGLAELYAGACVILPDHAS